MIIATIVRQVWWLRRARWQQTYWANGYVDGSF